MSVFQSHSVGFSQNFTALFSYSKYGVSNQENSLGTPVGIHIVCEKIGHNAPLNAEFVGRKFTGQIIPQSQNLSQKSRILTRILRLKGCELGINLGFNNNGCCDTYKRCVYIHGTNFETFIPAPLSHGCLILKNKDLVRLFDTIHTGDICWIF